MAQLDEVRLGAEQFAGQREDGGPPLVDVAVRAELRTGHVLLQQHPGVQRDPRVEPPVSDQLPVGGPQFVQAVGPADVDAAGGLHRLEHAREAHHGGGGLDLRGRSGQRGTRYPQPRVGDPGPHRRLVPHPVHGGRRQPGQPEAAVDPGDGGDGELPARHDRGQRRGRVVVQHALGQCPLVVGVDDQQRVHELPQFGREGALALVRRDHRDREAELMGVPDHPRSRGDRLDDEDPGRGGHARRGEVIHAGSSISWADCRPAPTTTPGAPTRSDCFRPRSPTSPGRPGPLRSRPEVVSPPTIIVRLK